MMQIKRFKDLQETPWKNGGGITREIAVVHASEALMWRLSIADVGIDAPFSRFVGLQRILTVIEGHGMVLVSPNRLLHADYATPLCFDGALEIEARLKQGPLRDFNLIYDPTHCKGHAEVIALASEHRRESKGGQTMALHCIKGFVSLGETELLHKGDTALFEGEASHFVIAKDSIALVITIQTAAKS